VSNDEDSIELGEPASEISTSDKLAVGQHDDAGTWLTIVVDLREVSVQHPIALIVGAREAVGSGWVTMKMHDGRRLQILGSLKDRVKTLDAPGYVGGCPRTRFMGNRENPSRTENAAVAVATATAQEPRRSLAPVSGMQMGVQLLVLLFCHP